MLLVRGRIYTLDPERPVVRALLCDGGAVRALDEAGAPAGAEVLDIGEGAAVPGLADAHGHLLGLGEALSILDLSGARSFEEVVARASLAARSLPPGAWLVGRGWDQNLWPDQRFPAHGPLSRALRDRPAALTRVDGHALLANAAALALAGVGAGTPDPPGGKIGRGPGGGPDGLLVDAAMGLVLDRLPRPGRAARARRLALAAQRCLESGLTQVHDAGADPETLALYRAAPLPLRVYAMVDAASPGADLERARGPRDWDAEAMLAVRAVKIYADGALGSRGALLFGEYRDAPGEQGLRVTAPEQQEEWARAWTRAGFQLAVHAIGDRAAAETLDLFARLGRELGPLARPRLEHAQILRRSDIPRLAPLGIVASMQPAHEVSDARWIAARLSPAQIEGAYAWRSLLVAGARLAFGSDFPVEPPNPLAGLRAAVQGGRSGERLSFEDALRAFTEGPAWASFAEGRRGRLARGMDADLTVLDADPFREEGLDRARVTATVVAGRVAWRR